MQAPSAVSADRQCPFHGFVLLSRRECHLTASLATLPRAWDHQVPACPGGLPGSSYCHSSYRKGKEEMRNFRLVGDPQGHKAAKASHPHPVQAASSGDTALSCPGVICKPCPCWGSHQPGLATRKDLQAPIHAGGRIWDPVSGAQVPGWPCPPACAGRVESAAGAVTRGHRQGPGSKERVQQGQWAALCPTQAVLARGAPAPLHMAVRCPEALQEGSDSVAPLC